MRDIVERLRSVAAAHDDGMTGGYAVMTEAASEIERLRRFADEIELRTSPYQDRWDEWPLVSGINQLVRATNTWKR